MSRCTATAGMRNKSGKFAFLDFSFSKPFNIYLTIDKYILIPHIAELLTNASKQGYFPKQYIINEKSTGRAHHDR